MKAWLKGGIVGYILYVFPVFLWFLISRDMALDDWFRFIVYYVILFGIWAFGIGSLIGWFFGKTQLHKKPIFIYSSMGVILFVVSQFIAVKLNFYPLFLVSFILMVVLIIIGIIKQIKTKKHE